MRRTHLATLLGTSLHLARAAGRRRPVDAPRAEREPARAAGVACRHCEREAARAEPQKRARKVEKGRGEREETSDERAIAGASDLGQTRPQRLSVSARKLSRTGEAGRQEVARREDRGRGPRPFRTTSSREREGKGESSCTRTSTTYRTDGCTVGERGRAGRWTQRLAPAATALRGRGGGEGQQNDLARGSCTAGE